MAETFNANVSMGHDLSAAASAHFRSYGEPTAAQRRAFTRLVASAAHDAADCAMLLDMLGLDAADGIDPVTEAA